MGLKWFLNFEGKTRTRLSPSVQKRVLLREVCGHVQYGESKLSEQNSATPLVNLTWISRMILWIRP